MSENDPIRLRAWGMTDDSAWRVTLDQGKERITIEVASKERAFALVAALRAAMRAADYAHEVEDVE